MRSRTLIPLIVATALFMENTDSTVIATSLPMIAPDLGEDPIALKLALTSYLVSLAIFIPVSGWMADRFGARTIFRAAIGVFMVGLARLRRPPNSLGGFVAARFLQGMGGAMMVPVGRLVILRSVPPSELVQALADPDRSRPWSGRCSGRRSAASSPPISTGAGSSSSTSRSASSGSCWRRCSSRTSARRTRRRSTGSASSSPASGSPC